MIKKAVLLFVSSLLSVASAQAAFITLNEAGMDAVFSQASFGNTPIDIRYGAASEIVAPSLLDISTAAEVGSLFSMHTGGVNTVNFYFIDTISACGISTGANIVGCGEAPGNDFVVESSFAAGSFGTELLAHELAHNLGLFHVNGANLLNPALNGSTFLDVTQANTILSSPLVQTDATGARFININPVLIVAAATTAVPAPATAFLMLAGVVAFSVRKRAA